MFHRFHDLVKDNRNSGKTERCFLRKRHGFFSAIDYHYRYVLPDTGTGYDLRVNSNVPLFVKHYNFSAGSIGRLTRMTTWTSENGKKQEKPKEEKGK